MDTETQSTQDAPTGDNNPDVEPNNPTALSDAGVTKPRKALLNSFITLSDAQRREEDMRAELQYAAKRGVVYTELQCQEEGIRKLVASHCGLESPDLVKVPEICSPDQKLLWLHGSFNVCIPVDIDNTGRSLPAKMAFRLPLPYRVGEQTFPGNAEEKVRSEAATYIWMNENCPDIPIPKLRGFGVPGGLSFFDPKSVSPWQRIRSYFWRLFCRLRGSPAFCDYLPQQRATLLDYSYILIDWIESDDSKRLSDTYTMPHTEAQTQNLYRSMSRIMISLARLRQPRIGSWTIDNAGHISLSNRPMLSHFAVLENWNIPTDIPRHMTYTSADTFYLDLLAGHDNRLLYQGNAAFDEKDARAQAKDLVLMRALLHRFTDRNFCDGPFVMQLTDMHISNIFVDKDWSITHIIDLEWACSLPIENLLPPWWLTEKCVDQIKGFEYESFQACYMQFTDIFEQEEVKMPLYYGHLFSLARIMKSSLENRRYWYLHALQTPKGLFNLFRTHLQPLFDIPSKDTVRAAVSSFWTPGMTGFVDMKQKEYAQYQQEVCDIFNSRKSGRFYN
ncbi:hypothetical protein PRK78_003110 [Emydomyces testavorans]|uniref:Aminoglycoside phosphotransferase domain-containing protein n=1 Tax=Emydomyces testavorans TaxID=2070801 RepID=A0AAF0II40_9EURO|nr:hypothetical protein PRK78_003110 [Emydomyces testavorans]